MSKENILVIDDHAQIQNVYGSYLRKRGYKVTVASDGQSALPLDAKDQHAVAIVDQSIPGLSGIETIRLLKRQNSTIEVIICTGYPSLNSSIAALHEQVFDYIAKPVKLSFLLHKVKQAAERRSLLMKNRRLIEDIKIERDKLDSESRAAKRAIELHLNDSTEFVGRSASVVEIRTQIASVGPSNMNVLLLGESGTGKDVVARLIHESSGREPSTFLKVNCPTIPETLFESELFGHEAGAFTGAIKRKPGRFELAAGGTIFLDEIGELPLSMQSKLLQAVEQKQFYSVGGKKPINSDVRIIAATNAPLSEMTRKGKFRADLYYRLNEYSITIPPLRDRGEDILLLTKHFLNTSQKSNGCPQREFHSDTFSLLSSYHWPGNIRELQSIIRRFAITGREEEILSAMTMNSPERESGSASSSNIKTGKSSQRHYPKGEGNRAELYLALANAKWNRREAAKALGISYSTIRRRISQYGLNSVPRESSANSPLRLG